MKTFFREAPAFDGPTDKKFHVIFEIHCAHCNVSSEGRTCVMVPVWSVSNKKKKQTNVHNLKVENYDLSDGLSEDLSLGGRL